MFSDLECDYINPIDLCTQLNRVCDSNLSEFFVWLIVLSFPYSFFPVASSFDCWQQFVLPEYIAHGFLAVLFLLSGQLMALALNLPLAAYNVRKYATG